DLGDLGDRRVGRGRERRTEVARAAAEGEVARGVGLMRAQQREVGADRLLEEVAPAAELAHLLALGDRRTDAGRCVEGGDSGPSGSHALDERALRYQLELDLARADLLRKRRPLDRVDRVRADESPDLVLLGERLQGERPDTRAVADQREILD